jgi:hypothetical protein
VCLGCAVVGWGWYGGSLGLALLFVRLEFPLCCSRIPSFCAPAGAPAARGSSSPKISRALWLVRFSG